MNGKQAKKLRAVARLLTDGAPWEAYEVQYGQKLVMGGMASYAQIRLQEGCGKQMYRTLKRNYHAVMQRQRGVMAMLEKIRGAKHAN